MAELRSIGVVVATVVFDIINTAGSLINPLCPHLFGAGDGLSLPFSRFIASSEYTWDNFR
jgi:hypothetical protein